MPDINSTAIVTVVIIIIICHFVIVLIDDIIDSLIFSIYICKIKQRKIKHLIKLSVEYTNHDYPHDDVIQFHDNHYYHHYA